MQEGRIIKAISGFYYVQNESGIYQCRGRGVFRIQDISPLVGDFVKFESESPDEGYILEILERKNSLVRPPVANIDQVMIVNSVKEPNFSTLLLDQFLVLIESMDIEPFILVTKTDLATDEEMEDLKAFQEIYEAVGYSFKLISTKASEQDLKAYLEDKVSVIAGQSGVGKTSLLNTLNTELLLQTNEISKSLGRGKHTTRHVELVQVGNGLIADTPGFSTLDFKNIEADELGDCFPEIRREAEYCKFRGCKHYKEPKCAVKEAVENGEIAKIRYEHYVRFLENIQNRKPRY